MKVVSTVLGFLLKPNFCRPVARWCDQGKSADRPCGPCGRRFIENNRACLHLQQRRLASTTTRMPPPSSANASSRTRRPAQAHLHLHRRRPNVPDQAVLHGDDFNIIRRIRRHAVHQPSFLLNTHIVAFYAACVIISLHGPRGPPDNLGQATCSINNHGRPGAPDLDSDHFPAVGLHLQPHQSALRVTR